MKKVMNFLKKYWLTAGVFIAMIVLYHYMSTGETAHNYLFPPAKNIWEAFVENKESFGVVCCCHLLRLQLCSVWQSGYRSV